jgi:hypothetical protein
MQAHVRNDVKQSVGLVVTLELHDVSFLSSIPQSVEGCINLADICRLPGLLRGAFFFIFFIACILVVKNT